MPFTVTHIAAALPVAWLCRWRLPFSALAIGCAIPDASVFYPSLIPYNATHSLVGILTHCTPLGVAFYYLYQSVLKRPLADLLPRRLSERLWPYLDKPIDFSFVAIASVFLCVAFGAATHVLWDSFTHGGRWGVQQIPALNSEAFSLNGRTISWYSVLQHASSVVFLPPLILGFLIWVLRQPRDRSQGDHFQVSRLMMWSLFIGSSVALVIYFWVSREWYPHESQLTKFAVCVKRSGAYVLPVVFGYCLMMTAIWAAQPKSAAIQET